MTMNSAPAATGLLRIGQTTPSGNSDLIWWGNAVLCYTSLEYGKGSIVLANGQLFVTYSDQCLASSLAITRRLGFAHATMDAMLLETQKVFRKSCYCVHLYYGFHFKREAKGHHEALLGLHAKSAMCNWPIKHFGKVILLTYICMHYLFTDCREINSILSGCINT
jgi:hypothetical protein